MSGMQIGYGSYRHPVGWSGLTQFTARVHHSARGFKLLTEVEANVVGDIVLQEGETEYDLTNHIQQLEAAYQNDGYDWGLYHTNGTPTAHFLWSGDPDSLTGNQIVQKSFPDSHGGEYVTGRSFQYRIRNEFLTAETPLLEYSETVEQVGDTGPWVHWHNGNRFNAPYVEYQSSSSLQTTVQAGYAITFGAWFDPPAPLLPRPWLLGQFTKIKRHHPVRYPQGYLSYRVDWSYKYITPYDFNTAYPTLR